MNVLRRIIKVLKRPKEPYYCMVVSEDPVAQLAEVRKQLKIYESGDPAAQLAEVRRLLEIYEEEAIEAPMHYANMMAGRVLRLRAEEKLLLQVIAATSTATE